MANLAAAAVVLVAGSSFPLADRFGKSMQESQADFTVTLANQGDGAAGSDIPASAFGMSVIREVGCITKSDNSVILVGAPKADGSGILLKNAGSNAPAQYSGVFNMRVKGRF